MTYSPKAIANFFLDKAESVGKSLTPLQVIKLTFIAHGWHLGLTGEPLVRETPEAWKYGPVFPSLYKEFRQFGDEPITTRAIRFANYEPVPIPPPSPSNEPKLCKFLDSVWQQYGHFTGGQLSTITHKENTPWYKTWYDLGGKDAMGVEIPEHLITEYYKGLASKNA